MNFQPLPFQILHVPVAVFTHHVVLAADKRVIQSTFLNRAINRALRDVTVPQDSCGTTTNVYYSLIALIIRRKGNKDMCFCDGEDDYLDVK